MRSRWKTLLAVIVILGMTSFNLRASMATAGDFDYVWRTSLRGCCNVGIVGLNGVSVVSFGDHQVRLPFPAPVVVGVPLAGVAFTVLTGVLIFSRRGKRRV
jgi:hypothetical protein